MGAVNRFSRTVGHSFPCPALKDVVSKSHKLFVMLGLTPQFSEGIVPLTPVLKKSLAKLENLVRKEMRDVSAVEMSLPILSNADLFEISKRMDSLDPMTVKSREKKFILNPTCEEAVTYFMKISNRLNFAPLPVRIYQISPKFRDEKRTKSGLLRTKEFIMKDLYCFDADAVLGDLCYQEVINKYRHFFDLLKVPYKSVKGSTESIGTVAHEFHFLSEAGEDRLILCEDCGHEANVSVGGGDESKCQNCLSGNVRIQRGIEVGHAFKLGTRFTEMFDVCNERGEPLHMSCYGLGLTRILAASVEVLCRSDSIRWPRVIAPYSVCVIPPKAGSTEEKTAGSLSDSIYHELSRIFEDDVIVDDRTDETIGARCRQVKKLGLPCLVILGKSVLENPPRVEIYNLDTNETSLVQISDVTQFVVEKVGLQGIGKGLSVEKKTEKSI